MAEGAGIMRYGQHHPAGQRDAVRPGRPRHRPRFLAAARVDQAAREREQLGAAVATHVGYGSEYSFSRAFTRFHGQPPGRYSRQSRTFSETPAAPTRAS